MELKVYNKLCFYKDFEEFEKLSKEAQEDKFLDIVAKYVVKKGKPIQIRTEAVLPEATIYHEMGHLQDFAKNQQVLDLKDYFERHNFPIAKKLIKF